METNTMSKSPIPIDDQQQNVHLGRRLYSMLQEGRHVDVVFLVGEAQTPVGCHKTILSAMSEVFASHFDDRWKPGDTIQLPPFAGLEAVQDFIKYIYLEELGSDLGIETALQLFLLGDMYSVLGLFSQCDTILLSHMTKDNCSQIYESTSLVQNSVVGLTAWRMLSGNIGDILRSEDKDSNNWLPSTWTRLLSDQLPNVDEFALLQGLVRWRDFTPERKGPDFDQLLSLVRFPLMRSSIFARSVLGMDILSGDEVKQLFIHFAGVGQAPSRFSSKQRNTLTARNSDELHHLLKYVGQGDTIELEKGEYDGSFVMEKKESVTIRGSESSHILGSFTLKSCSFCEIYGVHFKTCPIITDGGTYNALRSLKIEGDNSQPAVSMSGSGHKLERLQLSLSSSSTDPAILIRGCNNELCEIESRGNGGSGIAAHRIILEGNENKLNGFKVFDPLFIYNQDAVVLSGDGVEVNRVSCERSIHVPSEQEAQTPRHFCLVRILKGERVKVTSGTGPPNSTIVLSKETSNCHIGDSAVDTIVVYSLDGKRGHDLTNCSATQSIEVGGNFHFFEGCKSPAVNFTKGSNSRILLNCAFEVVTDLPIE